MGGKLELEGWFVRVFCELFSCISGDDNGSRSELFSTGGGKLSAVLSESNEAWLASRSVDAGRDVSVSVLYTEIESNAEATSMPLVLVDDEAKFQNFQFN